MAEAGVTVRPYSDEDEPLLLAALERAAAGSRERPRSRASLHWRYGQAPHGACIALATGGEGEVVAGIVATRKQALLEGQAVHWLEIGDMFNDFEQRGGLARARALVQAGRAFAEAFGGPGPEKHPVLYGVPNRRAHRLGLKHLEWEVLRSENELRASWKTFAPPSGPGVMIDEVARFPEEIAATFRRFAEGRGAILVRDAAFLNWRYVEHPERHHRIALARKQGELVGYAVLREGRLVDWIVPADERGAAGELLAWAGSCARSAGSEALSIIVPDTAPEWLAFQDFGFRAHGFPEYLCFRSFQRPALMSWLFKHWYYTRGDTDRSA